MQWFNVFAPQMPLTHIEEVATEKFAQGLDCCVTSAIYLYGFGRVTLKSDGISWRAQLCETECSTALLPGQPVIAISRQGNTLIVVPQHCLI